MSALYETIKSKEIKKTLVFDHTPINQISYSILTGFNRNLESLELFYVMFNMTLSSYLHLFQCQTNIIDDIKRNHVISRSRT